jgi:hypothetical protein
MGMAIWWAMVVIVGMRLVSSGERAVACVV